MPFPALETTITRCLQVPLYDADTDLDYGWQFVPQPPQPDGKGDWFILEDRDRKIVWARLLGGNWRLSSS